MRDSNAPVTTLDDLQALAETHYTMSQKTINNILIDNNKKSNRPKTYSRTSRTAAWRNKKEAKKMMNGNKNSESCGFMPTAVPATVTDTPILSESHREIIQINEKMKKLQELIEPVRNLKSESSKALTYNFVRYTSVNFYFLRRLEGLKRGQAFCEASRYFCGKKSTSYRARSIIRWEKEFLREGKLSDHSQGIHSKRKCFLNDSDVKAMVLREIRKTKPAERFLIAIKRFIDEVVVPSILGVVNRSVSETTISKYLYEWGYAYCKNKKTIYFDGHEREDVVAYRELWSKRMLEDMLKMDFYSGENEELVLEPEWKKTRRKLYLSLTTRVPFMSMMARMICECWKAKITSEKRGLDSPSWSASSNVSTMAPGRLKAGHLGLCSRLVDL